jgi:DNA methylase
MHPTVKPVALVADAILDCSKRGGIVLDVFAGSGTTLIAAEKAGRRGYGIEIATTPISLSAGLMRCTASRQCTKTIGPWRHATAAISVLRIRWP